MKTKFVTGDLSGYKRLWQGIPGIEVTNKGRIFVSLYSGGITEGAGNFAMLLCSDDGKDFSPIAVADQGPEGRAYDPCLWIDPLGRLWFIWSVQPENRVECAILADPDGDLTAWSDIKTIGFDVMLNKPIVAQNGDWLFPCAVWKNGLLSCGWGADGNPDGSHVFVSHDQGESFSLLGTAIAPNRHYDEHMVIQHPDSSYSMYIRTRYGIAVAESADGVTWTEGVDAGLGGPNSRFYIGRLQSGALLLINHHRFVGRNNLTAMISDDEGKTWTGHLLLDERKQVSYPDVTQAADGSIYIVYDRERGAHYQEGVDYTNAAREILYAKVTEADIRAGKGGSLKNIASKIDL